MTATLPILTKSEARSITLLALPIDIAAHRLGCSKSRFKQLSRSIAAKLGATDTKGAIVLAARAGVPLEIITPDGAQPAAH